MKFSELPLYQAIDQAHAFVDSPRSSQWIISRQRDLYMMIVSYMEDFSAGVPYTQTQVLDAWERFGKSKNENGVNKARLTIEVARVHGETCFYANRGLGECTDEIELERIVPGSQGGPYSVANCMIACSRHNNDRSDKNIQDYIATGQSKPS